MTTPRAVLLAVPLLLAACEREPARPAEPALPPAAEPTSSPDAPPVEIAPLEAAQRWMTYQYLLGTPEKAPSMVESFVRGGGHTADPAANALGVVGAFLARLGAEHPELLDDWVAAAESLSPESQLVFAYAVWDAEPGRSGPRLRRLAAAMSEEDAPGTLELIGQPPVSMEDLAPDTPGVLDFWWAAFLADGDTKWVDLVLSVIPTPEMSVEEAGLNDPARLQVAQAAAWSLVSNAAQHPRVLEHLRRRDAEMQAEWPTVAEIIRAAEEAAAANPPDLP